jgi:hypothetical protein
LPDVLEQQQQQLPGQQEQQFPEVCYGPLTPSAQCEIPFPHEHDPHQPDDVVYVKSKRDFGVLYTVVVAPDGTVVDHFGQRTMRYFPGRYYVWVDGSAANQLEPSQLEPSQPEPSQPEPSEQTDIQ